MFAANICLPGLSQIAIRRDDGVIRIQQESGPYCRWYDGFGVMECAAIPRLRCDIEFNTNISSTHIMS